MLQAKIFLHQDFVKNAIDDRIYSAFVEHMGRCVYHGIYEPEHPEADELGFRKDVKRLVKALNVPLIRYPGGNFVSNYRWEDGVGPREKRKAQRDAAWAQIEPNLVGTDEFHAWAKDVGAQVMMAVNLGTRGPAEAGALLEYCNLEQGSRYADMRVANGIAKPYGDKVWCLGNEMDGIWQIGGRTAADYADVARKTACFMKMLDPDIQLVACGSSNYDMPTFGDWEQTVLEQTYEHIDFLSLHQYFADWGRNDGEYLGAAADMDKFIHTVISICDAVGGKKHQQKKIHLSFDEWGVWPMYTKCNNQADRWAIGPAREEYRFCMLDTLVFATMMNCLLRHSERVKIACLTQLVNVCAPIMTEVGGPAWVQPIYYPFFYASRYGRGALLDMRSDSPVYEAGCHGTVPLTDAAAVWREETKEIALFLVSRSQEERCSLTLELTGFGDIHVIEHVVMEAEDRHAVNSAEYPDRVRPKTLQGRVSEVRGGLQVELLPLTWNMIRIQTQG